MVLNESSTFTIPYLDPRTLKQTSSINRIASRVGLAQASKTSELLTEMGVVSTVSTLLASNLSTKYRPSKSWKTLHKPGSNWKPESAFRVHPSQSLKKKRKRKRRRMGQR